MINSMTGFGSAEGAVGGTPVSVEVRAVNHRFFNPSLKLPGAWAALEGEVRELLRRRVARGHVTLMVKREKSENADSPALDEGRLVAYLTQLRSFAERNGISEEISMDTLLRLPSTLSSPVDESVAPVSFDEVADVVGRAVSQLSGMRRTEGEQISRFLVERLRELEKTLDRIAKRAPVRLTEQHARVKEVVRELVGRATLDEQRVAMEVALLAEKLDVAEELDRFQGHITAFLQSVESESGEPVGKRLGFLAQEMVREANTLGSKANDAEILADVILLKEELEKIREQVENVE